MIATEQEPSLKLVDSSTKYRLNISDIGLIPDTLCMLPNSEFHAIVITLHYWYPTITRLKSFIAFVAYNKIAHVSHLTENPMAWSSAFCIPILNFKLSEYWGINTG